MPYDVKPKHNLSNLTKSKVYKQVSQLVVKRQLAREVRILNSNLDLAVNTRGVEVYSIKASYLDKSSLVGKVGSM